MDQVANRHGEYEHEWLTPDYFAAMAEHLPGRSHVVAIKLDGTIVAFGLGLVGDNDYFGVAEGMDYTVRDSLCLYSNLFLEVIRVACELGKQSLNLGITTYDFKDVARRGTASGRLPPQGLPATGLHRGLRRAVPHRDPRARKPPPRLRRPTP